VGYILLPLRGSVHCRVRFCRPYGAWSFFTADPRLTPWAIFFRRFAAPCIAVSGSVARTGLGHFSRLTHGLTPWAIFFSPLRGSVHCHREAPWLPVAEVPSA